MKYLKKYEEIKDLRYWIVPTDERFIKSLKEIGCDKKFIDYQAKNENILLQKYVYISYDTDKIKGKDWYWSSGYPEYGKKNYSRYKFMGYVNIDDSEILSEKYNI